MDADVKVTSAAAGQNSGLFALNGGKIVATQGGLVITMTAPPTSTEAAAVQAGAGGTILIQGNYASEIITAPDAFQDISKWAEEN